MCGVSGDVGGGTLSHNLGSAGWPSPSPLLCVPHPRAGLTSHHPRPPNLWPSPSPGHPPLDMHRPGGAHRSSTHTPAHPPGWLPAATPPSPHSLLLPADQPGAQQGLKTPIFLLAWSLRTALSPLVSLESKPFPSLGQFCCCLWGSGLRKATTVISPAQARPLHPYFKPSMFLNRIIGGLSPEHLPRFRAEPGAPQSLTDTYEKRITLGIWEKAKVHDFQDKIPESLLEPGPSCSLVFRMQEALVPGPC